jgi:hypothetical protein
LTRKWPRATEFAGIAEKEVLDIGIQTADIAIDKTRVVNTAENMGTLYAFPATKCTRQAGEFSRRAI